MHIILAVTDQGTPPLTRYQRVMVTVQPDVAAVRAPQVGWGAAVLQQPPEWYASPQARAIADAVLLYQSPVGAWPKNTDLARPRPAAMSAAEAAADPNGNTIDNDGTTLPMEFLARMVLPTGDARYRAAFERGVDYLLAAQYPNGGWPQFFPLREGYYSRITYNDNAMIRVLRAAARRRRRHTALRLRRCRAPRQGRRRGCPRPRRHPAHAVETRRRAHGVVRSVRRTHARARLGAQL